MEELAKLAIEFADAAKQARIANQEATKATERLRVCTSTMNTLWAKFRELAKRHDLSSPHNFGYENSLATFIQELINIERADNG